MTSSLVGSEMCIRDRYKTVRRLFKTSKTRVGPSYAQTKKRAIEWRTSEVGQRAYEHWFATRPQKYPPGVIDKELTHVRRDTDGS
eukprot:12909894-Prorocentrum_lima.AAC.1